MSEDGRPRRFSNLYGDVADTEGNPLSGASVHLDFLGSGFEKLQVTNGMGRFRFLNLWPGHYTVKASRDGFSTSDPLNITMVFGRSADIVILLWPDGRKTGATSR